MATDYLQQLIDAIGSSSSSQTQEAAPTGQAGLQPFFDTPMYQLLFGQNANQVDPTQRFKADPGFEFNQSEAARQMNMYGASKGLLESGPMQQEMQRQLQANQNNQYQTWLGQQGTVYNNYQDRLAGLSAQGAQQSGADQTAQMAQILGTLLSGNTMSTGQNTANANMGTGENISTLLGNQGVMNANLISNSAAARANALMQAFGMNAQMQNNAASSAAQQQSSALQGQGAMAGASQLGRLF